ncbi:MAG: FtsQ-type POTRA domain-containing protein [Minisyncoccales bacterium]
MKRRIKAKRRTMKRRKKSIFTNFYFSFSIFASIIVLSAAGFLLFSPRFQVSELNISGNNNILTEDLKKAAGEKFKTSFSLLGFDISTESIFLSMGNGVNDLMESFPEIEKITVKKDFPNGVSLQIVEKTPYAVWTDSFDDAKKYLIDKNGSYIKNFEDREEYASLIKINQKEEIENIDKKNVLENLSKIKEGLTKYSININNFDIYKTKTIIQTVLSCEIIFYIGEDRGYADLDWQIEKLGIVLNDGKYAGDLNSLKYIDLRFGNKTNICKIGSECDSE